MQKWKEKVELLRKSGRFDANWYNERYPDVALSGMDPAEHFVRIGQAIGRHATPGDSPHDTATFLSAIRPAPKSDFRVDESLRHKIMSYSLFDDAWYRKQHAPDLGKDDDALSHYFVASAEDPTVDPGPLFSTMHYANAHPDTSSMAPIEHAARYGIQEGRAMFDPIKINKFLRVNRENNSPTAGIFFDVDNPITILCWNDGNFFFKEIADYLSQYFKKSGFAVNDAQANGKVGNVTGNVIIVAPHEFCVYGPGKYWSESDLAKVTYFNTEQWQTSWFTLSLGFIKKSNRALDLNSASAAGLRKLGINAAFVPILPLSGTPFDVGKASVSKTFADSRFIRDLRYPVSVLTRPYDILFVGAANARREAALASMAAVLARHEAFIHCPRFRGPVRPESPDLMSTSDLVQIALNTKILLNIHQGASHYFEWHRLFLFGMMQGCLVLTEKTIPNSYVKSGDHYIECDVGEMPDRLSWLLETDEGQKTILRINENCRKLRLESANWRGFEV